MKKMYDIMPISYDPIFFTIGQNTHRLHFQYLLDGFEKSMLAGDDKGEFTSDTREYFINGFKRGNSTYNVRVRETGVDILPGRIDAWFSENGAEATIPLDLLADIKRRREEATQNRILVNINGVMIR